MGLLSTPQHTTDVPVTAIKLTNEEITTRLKKIDFTRLDAFHTGASENIIYYVALNVPLHKFNAQNLVMILKWYKSTLNSFQDYEQYIPKIIDALFDDKAIAQTAKTEWSQTATQEK